MTWQRDRFQQCLDIAGVIILALDSEGVVTQINHRGCTILGRPEDDVVGHPWIANFIPEPHREATRAVFQGIMSGELDNVEFFENPVLTSDGQERIIAWHNQLLHDEAGGIVGTLSSGEDITERRQAERALRQNEELYRITIDSLDSALHLVDRDLHVRLFNQSFRRWCDELNLTRGPVGGTLKELFPFLPQRTFDEYQQVFEHGQAMSTSESIELAGQRIFTETSKYPVVVDGQVKWVITKVTNVTQRRQAQGEKEQLHEQLAQSQKMESIGRLAGGVAHDFNNLLTAICGFSDIVHESLDPEDPLKEDVAQIIKAADSAATLTNQLLAFSRKQIISPRAVDLNEAVARSEKMLRRIIGEDIDFSFHPAPGLKKVLIDPGQVDQILVNLAANSRDVMPRGGRLNMETRNLLFKGEECETCSEAVDGDHIVLTVRDDGPGIDAETRKNIFEPFFTTKERGKGTGLGLSTVHGIVHQNGGHIRVISAPGEGTAFHIYLPVALSRLTPRQLEAPTPMARGSELILVVEDQDLVRKMVTRILRGAGYQVHTANSGGEALASLSGIEDRIDLLLTDVVMPKMSGTELYKRLSRTMPGLRALFMSGFPDETVAVHGVLDEGINFIQKPFQPHELVRRIRQLLDLK